jgi:hypothetical protein
MRMTEIRVQYAQRRVGIARHAAGPAPLFSDAPAARDFRK